MAHTIIENQDDLMLVLSDELAPLLRVHAPQNLRWQLIGRDAVVHETRSSDPLLTLTLRGARALDSASGRQALVRRPLLLQVGTGPLAPIEVAPADAQTTEEFCS